MDTPYRLWSSLVACVALIAVLALLPGCGGSSSGSAVTPGDNPGVTQQGIALPTEVSAISADNGSASPAGLSASIRKLAEIAAQLPADSDYKKTVTATYVDEPTLEVFGIIETILKAMAQTNYDLAENVGAGPYKTIVSWFDEQDGKAVKELQEWIVESTMTEDGVNNIHTWITDGDEQIKVNVNITTAPEQDSEGNYLNYGEWTIQATFGNGTDFGGTFYADAAIAGDGTTILRLSEATSEQEDFQGAVSPPLVINNNTKAVMYKAATSGYGVAQIADWDTCWNIDWENGATAADSPCVTGAVNGEFTLPAETAQYAYNQNYLALQLLDANGAPAMAAVYKDRNDKVRIPYRYGLFDAVTGANVEKAMRFGFPVTIDNNGSTMHGYYGAWQGRHQLWAGPNGSLPDGTTVSEEVWDSQVTPATFTTKSFNGTLVKRDLVPASLNQIDGLPLEIWLWDGFEMAFDGSAWNRCAWDPTAGGGFGDMVCADPVDLNNLVYHPQSRKQIELNACFDDNGSWICNRYAYADDGQGNLGFYELAFGNDGPSVNTANVYVPTAGDRVWVNINGSTYIEYSAANGWVEKNLVNFDQQTWTPQFDGDLGPFELPLQQEYYVNNKGVSFVVKRVASNGDAADYQVQMEIQTVANPNNAASFLTGATYLAYPWEDANVREKFALDSNPASPTYMMLVYAADSQSTDKVAGDLLAQGAWGLMAYDGSDQPLDVQFNWEYAGNNGGGTVTYLVDVNGDYVYLDDPIMLDPLELTSAGGDTLNFSLQFDGWMHGLPDLHWELEKSNYDIAKVANKIIAIPAGTLVTQTGTANSYFVKPLEVGVVLATETAEPAGAPDLSQADGIDLASFVVPAGIDIGPKPTGLTLKYVEGKAAQ